MVKRYRSDICQIGSDGKKYGINFNFNGWGEKQEYSQDSLKSLILLAKQANAIIQTTDLVLEGGMF